MASPTTTMGLLKGVGGDNARDYLKTDLAAGLDLIDVHRHEGGASGLQIRPAALSGDVLKRIWHFAVQGD